MPRQTPTKKNGSHPKENELQMRIPERRNAGQVKCPSRKE
jgi:hypothetical protein